MRHELLTVEQKRAVATSIFKSGILEHNLMERAGEEVVEVILEHFSLSPTLIFCGPGKNGCDGQIVARLLKDKGWPVEIMISKALPSLEKMQEAIEKADVIVDALFGTGLARPLENSTFHLVDLINKSKKPVVSVDIPSGIEADSGACLGVAVQATYTVTFFRAHPGHYLLPGRMHVGKLFVRDIGISETFLPKQPIMLNAPKLWKSALKIPQPTDNKYTRGTCLIVGCGCMPGAIRLGALAARRVGAGLVRITCKVEEYPILASNVWGEIITPLASAEEFLKWTTDNRIRALLVGTGAMPSEAMRDEALLVLSSKKPCVLDGGALSSFDAQNVELASKLHKDVILTPHEGEFARLFPHLAFLNNKLEKVQKAAAEVGSTIVLKGYDTVIATSSGQVAINANAPATLSTAGTGDVLAGLIVGLLAQGVSPFEAACAGVWIHSEAANSLGFGLIAEDLPGRVPTVLHRLLY